MIWTFVKRTRLALNTLSIDAVLIGVLWLMVFSTRAGAIPTTSDLVVLSLSIWLTYTADRLFDVRSLSLADLHSERHRFAKIYASQLWRVWWCLLFVNIAVAINLPEHTLTKGFWLLSLCLLYTFANRLLRQHRVPKEFIVGVIFAASVYVFHPAAIQHQSIELFLFAYLCAANCLLITQVDSVVDLQLRQNSAGTFINRQQLHLFLAAFLGLCLFAVSSLAIVVFVSGSLLLLLSIVNQKQGLKSSSFRTLADDALLLPPAAYLLLA